ncbi:MAG: acid phosphatase AphA [Treponema sp.]
MKTCIKKCAAVLLLLSIFSFAFAKGPKVPYTHDGATTWELAGPTAVSKPIKWVSVEDIRKSIEKLPPMVVSFDIDDTVLVSSAIFYYGKNKYSPDSFDYLKNQEFWDFASNAADLYSIPKESARALIDMHQKRGDQIIFITGRTGPKGYAWKELDPCAKILRDTFSIKNMKPIYYRDQKYKEQTKYDKAYHIIRQHSQLHYGDSDDDILAAREAGIRGIRVLRSEVSTNLPMPVNGGYGEEVLIDSSR